MTSENGSYIYQSSTTTPKTISQGGCMVKICPLNKDVCRIRYDFNVSNKSIIEPKKHNYIFSKMIQEIAEKGSIYTKGVSGKSKLG